MLPSDRTAARVVVVGVKRLADYLKRKIEGDPNLQRVFVRGEISNLSVSARGHCNFDLKEGDAILRCFAFEDDYARFPRLKNGVAIVATGGITTYPGRSSYQLLVRAVEREGIGDVAARFDERKRKLAAEGLFAPERKRPLPPYPFRIALVSSRSANGALDFTTILRERAPHVHVLWCETTVQGPNAAGEIVAALGRASRADVDAIVVTRGGGSFEDLFVFSDENVVRAVARARHPVLSAIGHTADQQLCDFAADAHVETPSAAAKALGRDARELRAQIADCVARGRRVTEARLAQLGVRLASALVRSRLAEPRAFLVPLAQRLDDLERMLEDGTRAALRARDERLRTLVRRLEARDPSLRLAERGRRLEAAARRLDGAIGARVEGERRRRAELERCLEPAVRAGTERRARRLEIACAHLDGKNPEAILQRGYAIVTYGAAIVRDPAAVPSGALVEARLARGTLTARVELQGADGN